MTSLWVWSIVNDCSLLIGPLSWDLTLSTICSFYERVSLKSVIFCDSTVSDKSPQPTNDFNYQGMQNSETIRMSYKRLFVIRICVRYIGLCALLGII